MEALRNKPIGYKSWSEISPPISPDHILSDIYPPSSMKNSLEYSAYKDAMLLVISNLIQENRSLKYENDSLRKEMLMQQASSSVEAEQADTFSSKRYRKPKSAHQETLHENIFVKPCVYCQERHIYGPLHCKAFGAVCTFCQGRNHLEIACFYKNPDLLFGRRRKYIRNSPKPKNGKSRESISSTLGNSKLLLTNLKVHDKDLRKDSEKVKTNMHKSVEKELRSDMKSTIEFNQLDRFKMDERKRTKSIRKRNRRSSGQSRLKFTTSELIEGEADAHTISYSSGTEAYKEKIEEYPGQQNVLRTQLQCMDILGLTHQKEYEEIKMKIKTLQEKKCNILINI